ncbi:MAG: prolyl-tRNA synthetase associated domain-containing protein [Alphaproteobacteria bacterium]|nr:prolyl-tRNA synthetase associated domain-containing protein [Alphaproteobacteria bacterium]
MSAPDPPAALTAPAAPALPASPASPDDLFAFLDRLGIAVATVRHAPLFTVAESKALRGALAGAHCKSLFVKDKRDRRFLVVAAEDRPLDLKALADLIGAGRLSFASPERLWAELGVRPGSVTPFALVNDRAGLVNVVLDAAVMAAPAANFHPLTNEATTTIAPADLLRFVAATGHRARIIDLEPATRR